MGWPGDSLCSHNARSRTPLVGRAHDGKAPGRPFQRKEEGKIIWLDSAIHLKMDQTDQ